MTRAKHRWYMTFAAEHDSTTIYLIRPLKRRRVGVLEFEDHRGAPPPRLPGQPQGGLGFRRLTGRAYMWRTMIWPNNFL